MHVERDTSCRCCCVNHQASLACATLARYLESPSAEASCYLFLQCNKTKTVLRRVFAAVILHSACVSRAIKTYCIGPKHDGELTLATVLQLHPLNIEL